MRHAREKKRTIVRDVPQLPVGFFKFHRAQLQLLDEMSDPFIINVLYRRFFVCSGTVRHCFA